MDNNTNIHNVKVGDQIKIISFFDILKIDSTGITTDNQARTSRDFKTWKDFNDRVKSNSWEIIRKQENMLTELPERWYVRATRENEQVLRKWRKGDHTGWSDTLVMLSIELWSNLEGVSKYYQEYTEISFEDFKRLVLKEEKMYTKEDILKEGIVVFLETEEEHRELSNFIGRTITGKFKGAHYYRLSDDTYSGDSSKGNLGYYKKGNYKGINFNQIQMNKKIIGYKAPFNMWNGTIQAGEILIKTSDHGYGLDNSKRKVLNTDSFPKEIVETWEPVFAQEEIKIGESIVEFRDSEVLVNKKVYTKVELKELLRFMNLHQDQVKSINVGCSGQYQVDIQQLTKIVENLT